MANSSKHAALIVEIAKLREQQLEDLSNAAFLGWTPELLATHEKRKRRIEELLAQLVGRDGMHLDS